MAFKTGSKNPLAASLSTSDSISYTNLNNLLLGGFARATGNVPNRYVPTVDQIKIVVGGVINATNKASGAPAGGSVNFSPTNWGAGTLTVAQLKASDFGFMFKYSGFYGIKVMGFDFSTIPDNATITDIKLNYQYSVNNIGGGDATFDAGAYTADITFTYPQILAASGWNEGLLIADNPNPKPIERVVRYSAFDKDRNFIGEYTRVSTTPSIKTNINNLHSSMTFDLAQNDLTEEQELFEVMTESSDNVLTEAGDKWLGELTTAVSIGDGTNMDTNVEIDVNVAYGQWLPWLTEDGHEIITEDNRLIIVADGYPDGRRIFGGYISSWDMSLDGEDNVVPNLLSHSQELKNILLTTQDTPTGYSYLTSNSWIGMRSQMFNGTNAMGQSFVPTATQTIAGLSIWAECDIATTLTVTLRTGSDPTGGTIIAQGSRVVNPSQSGLIYTPFEAPVSLTSGSTYTFTLESSSTYEGDKSGSGYPLRVQIDSGAGLATGTGKWQHYPYFTWYDGIYDSQSNTTKPFDVKFQLYQAGGDTTVNFYSVDPSFALKEVLRFAQTRGSRVKFSDTTIDMTGTVITLQLNSNTIDEAIEAILKSMPGDWYIRYDPGTDEVHARPRPTGNPRMLLRKSHLIGSPKIKKTIEKLVNDVLYSGGDMGSGTNLLVRVQDTNSIGNIRRGFEKISDSRVKVLSTAQILAQAEIDRYKLPIYSGTATIHVNDDFYLEDITVGELQKLGNFSAFVDTIPAMQAVGVTYEVDTVTVEWNLLLPKVSKRIEDIRRNLALQEMENNPTSPS